VCRLFGMSAGSEPARATFWLLDAPDSLAQQSHREPDGTGLGWFDAGGTPQVRKQSIAAYGDAAFAREAREISACTFIAHVRFASTGALELRNTHPFEQDGRLFAHNGVIEDLPALERRLGDAQHLVRGDTDSERFFALITREVAARRGDVGAGIAAAASWVAEQLPLFAINCVLSTAKELWALRYPDTHELYVLERDAGTVLRHESRFGTRVQSDHAREHPLVVIASERMDEDPGWRLLDSGELLHISATLEVQSHLILHGPPARLLTLADLSEQARASQTHSPATSALAQPRTDDDLAARRSAGPGKDRRAP
jgi:predicted glutamine amidotransferase